jgi:SAM-dependent methyltransferase
MSDDLKELVRSKYAELADANQSCCGSDRQKVYQIMMDDYSQVAGYVADADLGLGCGLPTQFAKIRPGDTVLDLGSGAGNDCFVARHEVGETGYVIGVDFTPEMIARARENAAKRGFTNVEFREGDIEALPVADQSIDVVVSNCVLNLVPNKAAVAREVFRVLKPSGHFSISDIVLVGSLPEALRHEAELYAGCVSGAIPLDDYVSLFASLGFLHLQIQKQKPIHLPDDVLHRYLSPAQVTEYRDGSNGIFSITLYGVRPMPVSCCG